jgi:hypothetical protein
MNIASSLRHNQQQRAAVVLGTAGDSMRKREHKGGDRERNVDPITPVKVDATAREEKTMDFIEQIFHVAPDGG